MAAARQSIVPHALEQFPMMATIGLGTLMQTPLQAAIAQSVGLGTYLVSDGNETHCPHCGSVSHDAADCPAHRAAIADVASLASRVADLETQIIGQDATIAGLRTHIADLEGHLSARHGAAGEPQTGVSIPCETPRAFSYGWATNWRMR
jgi:hypothetical protein